MKKLSSQEILAQAAETIKMESRVVDSLTAQLDERFWQACVTMLGCTGHVLVSGAGTMHAVGLRLAHLLSCCGTPALFIHPGDSQHGSAGAVTDRDVLVAFSKGGETLEVNFLAGYAHRRGVKVIGITENPASSLANLSDVLLCVKPPEGCDPYGMIATGSSLFYSALGDAICVSLLTMRGYTREQFSATHPGGAVGIKINNEKSDLEAK